MPKPRQSPTRSGLLPEARHVVLPDGIVASGFPRVRETCRSVGITFDSWQSDLNKCLLAKSADGLLAADTAALSIARQVGKTFDVGAVEFAECIAVPGTTVVWTAHRFKVARETFNELRALAKSPKLVPHLDYDEITTAAGNEMIPFRNESRIVFAARERGAIRGFTKVRRLILDEAQILTEMALSDLLPTMNQAHDPQIIFMGTPPKPTDPSEVWTRLRAEALSGESEGLLFVEISADDDADPDDREQWRKANPSYPSRTPERAILRLRRLLTTEDFLREALGIWNSSTAVGALDVDAWRVLAEPPPPLASPSFGADLDEAGAGWLAVAWRRPDGHVHVQLAGKASVSTLQDRCEELTGKWGGRVAAGGGAASVLDDADVVSSGEFAAACVWLDELLTNGQIRHCDEPALNDAVKVARWRTVGTSGERAWQLKNAPGIGPLAAVTRAVHGLLAGPSVYEERGLIVL